MPVTYKEPQATQSFDFNVATPTTTGAITIYQPPQKATVTPPAPSGINSRNPDLGRPHNIPTTQNNLRNEGQYRTIELTPDGKGGYALPQKYSNQVPNYSNGVSFGRYPQGVTEADVQLSLVVGKFLLGICPLIINNVIQFMILGEW